VGHQETLFPLFQALENPWWTKVPPAGALFFEYYTERSADSGVESELLVNLVFKDGDKEE